MLFDLIFLLSASVLSFILYPFWIEFVYRFQMGEDIREDGPQTHFVKRGTPTMGGLVFVVAVSLVTFFLNRSRTQTLFPLFVGLLAGLFGLVEDFGKVYSKSGLPGYARFVRDISIKIKSFLTPNIKSEFILWTYFKTLWEKLGSTADYGLKTHQKFLIQACIGGFTAYWVYFKLGWDFIWMPLLGDVHIGILYPIFVFFFFITIMNSVNFTDGLDGLLGGLSVIALSIFWVIASVLEYNMLAGFCATFIGALLPFLYFNVYPARIFMGNVGSYALGATFAILAVVLHREVAFFFIGLLFFAIGISSPLQQLSMVFTKKRVFRMAPLHHHFEMLGWPETKVTLRFWIFGAFMGLVGLFIAIL